MTAAGRPPPLHLRRLDQTSRARPLLCLHPIPHSGEFFAEFLQRCAAQRTVLAPDYPGYGHSPASAELATIELYAQAIGECLLSVANRGVAKPVAALGFHTGCLVGVELSLRYPELIDGLILVDVPYFEPRRRAELRAEYADDNPQNAGFRAAFSYDCEARFAAVRQRGLIIATGSALRQATLEAAQRMPTLTCIEEPQIVKPAFSTGGARLAELVGGFLDG